MTDLTPIPCQAYMHRYGGLYRVVDVGQSTVDRSEHVVYLHIYPFEQQLWIRPRSEWTSDRFSPISSEEVLRIMSTIPREQLQQQIAANKDNK